MYASAKYRRTKETAGCFLPVSLGAYRKVLGYEIGLVEFGWPVGMPVCRPLGSGLWEVRSSLLGNRIARVIFCITDGRMVLLHGFIKKTRKTPKADLDLARNRKNEVER
jgi:phage-related protein